MNSNSDYALDAAQREAFARDGWATLPGFVAADELSRLEATYEAMLRRRIAVPGRDYCDMTGDYERPVEDYEILNVMLPRRYHPPLRDNGYERRAAAVARALCGDDMELDYDQFVAKPPRKPDALFHWHQDLGYWPHTPDTRTASFWLALDDTDLDSGCLQFVDGSHLEPELRGHVPLLGDRDKNHTMVAAVDEATDRIRPARLRRGDATVHHERVVHGSGGKTSDRWRRGYVIAFRSRDTVRRERAMGFTHSHNDPPEVLARIARQVGPG
ncbi:MAG: phytanoyl-CoA dioxygenase family protein [Planctomycetes bacterium]|nr:phytanoyl-CoA dioxygenase family protein [Planctomycetota bacterium]